uniref:Secreted protein n=1 Tax=Meloidogyne hapla TaxID=6305 RepID=A0A1I8BI09_MELHA
MVVVIHLLYRILSSAKRMQVLMQAPSPHPTVEQPSTDRILHCFQSEPDHRSQWSILFKYFSFD